MSLSKSKNLISVNQMKAKESLLKFKTLAQNDNKTNIKTSFSNQITTNSFRKPGTMKFNTSKNSPEKIILGVDRNLSEGKGNQDNAKNSAEEEFMKKNSIKRKSESKQKPLTKLNTFNKTDFNKDIPKLSHQTKSIINTSESCISPRLKEETKITINKLNQIDKLKQATKIEIKTKSELNTSKNSRKGSEEKNIFKAVLTKDKNENINNLTNLTNLSSLTTPKIGSKLNTHNNTTNYNSNNSNTSYSKSLTKKINTNTSVNVAGSENVITDSSKNSKNNLMVNSHNIPNINNNTLTNLKIQLNQKNPINNTLTNKSSHNIFLKKKSNPISVSVTNQVSKNNSKNNSKSSSRIDDKAENMRKRIIETEVKKIGIGIGAVDKNAKKHFTSTNSPTNQPLKFNKDNGIKKLITSSFKNKSEKPAPVSVKHDAKDSIEKILDVSTTSVHSSMREGNYYKLEAEKIHEFIKTYYKRNGDYPTSSLKFYKIGRQLGRGTFGKVNLGLHIATGRLVAIKSFNKKNFTTDYHDKRIYYEIKIMKTLKHNNIVKLYETIETDKYILIVLEYICGGDLLTFVRKRHKLNESTAKSIFKQIMDALYHIHSQNIVHRDIKLDNILIDLSNNIKICDFGVSRQVKRGETIKHQCGTPAYIAPEILKNEGYEGFGVDIWSAGVVLYAMLSGTVPFKANNMNQLHELILTGTYAYIKDISDDAWNLIKGMLEIDPYKRLTDEQILNHKWLRGEDSKIKTSLFTAAERILLSKSNIDYRKAGKDDITEHFTIKNLNTIEENINQNVNTRSHILAPFNSSGNHEKSYSLEIKNENEIFKFCGKAKEANRNYELNNNCEIDNGIIIAKDVIKDVKIENEEKSINFENNEVDSNIPTPKEETHRHSKNLRESLLKTNSNTYVLDESVMKQVECLGFSKEFLFRCLQNGIHNYATASYYLLLDNHICE